MSRSILIADEDPGVLTFLTLLFEKEGLRVLRARSHAEILEILERHYIPVDLVLVNGAIPHRGGCDLEQDIAALRGVLPLILMSAFVDSGVIRVELCDRSGHSAKPRPGVLEAVLSALAGSRVRAHG